MIQWSIWDQLFDLHPDFKIFSHTAGQCIWFFQYLNSFFLNDIHFKIFHTPFAAWEYSFSSF